ncbi:lysylphosphatidylglycerol synthase transmembrane domain-containing protein [Amycolatopsis thermalba]|uniref:lysylphosphatidylglycerol synthase transmembrane domain-containing protein n=1 Tax=Amycolatopsis thermalba TaxID=944492 RepID=UPI001F0744EF|nr:lysylphosphatidylglycerol synthase transmembrane domain-containing protein [Amycolatopsis thermalba]
MKRLLDVARWVALAVVAAFVVRVLAGDWTEFWRALRSIAWPWAVLSLAALVASITVSTYGWQTVVDGLGDRVGYRRGARICLVGQLGKYVPGSVWAYLLQMELGRKAGVSRARIFTGSLVQFGIGLVAALLLSALALPVAGPAVWLLVLLPAGLVALHPRVLAWGTGLALRLLRRDPLPRPLGFASIARAFAASVLAWTLQGLHLWLLAPSLNLWTCVGAMAIAMTAGTFAFLLPSGAGMREAVLVALLGTAGFSAGQALAFALVSRVMFTVADLLTALAATLPTRESHAQPRESHA